MNKTTHALFMILVPILEAGLIGLIWGLIAYFGWDVSRDAAYVIGFVAYMFTWHELKDD
jgi:hypothetical protein